jgi:hypothetical protein
MEQIKLPYESNDVVPFPKGAYLSADNLNAFPNQILENVFSLRDNTQNIRNTLLALINKPADYDDETVYAKYDLVTDSLGETYISVKDDNKGNDLNDTNYWLKWYVRDVNNHAAVFNKTKFVVEDSSQNIFNVSCHREYTDVYLNGVKLIKDQDYSVSDDQTQIILTDSASQNDVIEVVVWNIGSILDIMKIKRVATSQVMSRGDIFVCVTSGDSVDSGAAFTLTLPTKPTNGTMIEIMDGNNNAQNRPILIGNAGANINGVKDSILLDVNGFRCKFIYDAIKNNWSMTI